MPRVRRATPMRPNLALNPPELPTLRRRIGAVDTGSLRFK